MITASAFPDKPNPSKIRAIVLGCDPTAFKNKIQVPLKTAFGIGQDGRYFAGIKANLALLNIGLDNIFVQNLIPQSRNVESSTDPDWIQFAQSYIPDRVKEFDNLDPSRAIPVFLTSELLYKALLNKDQFPKKPIEIYNNENEVIISASANKLFRPLIILYRHPAYSFKMQTVYKEKLQKHFKF